MNFKIPLLILALILTISTASALRYAYLGDTVQYSNDTEYIFEATQTLTRASIITFPEQIKGNIRFTYDSYAQNINTITQVYYKINGAGETFLRDNTGAGWCSYPGCEINHDLTGVNYSAGTTLEIWIKNRVDAPTGQIGIRNFRVKFIDVTNGVGNWTLNQGTGSYANDTSGLNNNGTVTGATWTTDSVNGSALNFNDGSDRVTIPQSESLNVSSNITIAGWYKQESLPATFPTLFGRDSSYFMKVHTTGRIYGSVTIGGSQNTAYSTSIPIIPNDAWHFVMMTYDGATVTTYYDNVAYFTLAATGNIDPSADNVYLGSNSVNSIDGTLDEWKIYNYALNSTERTTLYQQFHPVPAYPIGGLTITGTYPPITESVNFSWHNSETDATELIIASDSNFNLIVVDQFTSDDFYAASLGTGTYYWKVRQYNTATETYGSTSATQNFTVSLTSGVTGAGIQGVVYEYMNGIKVPVSGATVYIYNNTYASSQTVGSNGYFLFSGLENSSTYTIYALKQLYDVPPTLPVTTGNGTTVTNDIQLTRCSSIFSSQCGSSFVYEKFILRGFFEDPYPGVTVNIYEDGNIVPLFSGLTDSMGFYVAKLIKDQYYRVEFSGGGLLITQTIFVYAKDEEYQVPVYTGLPTRPNRDDYITWNFSANRINATYYNLSLNYTDIGNTTTLINFYAYNVTDNFSAPTYVCYTVYTNTNSASFNCTVPSTKLNSYIWGFNATSSLFGYIDPDNTITFGGNHANPIIPYQSPSGKGIPEDILNYVSAGILIIISAMFGAQKVKEGAVVVPVAALFLRYIGWLELPTPEGNGYGLIMGALALGILTYMKNSEVKVQ